MIKIENRVLYKVNMNNIDYKFRDLYEITQIFNQYMYKDKMGRRLIREYLYTVSLIYFPELPNCFF
ncbi:hypothetical protein LCGC14_1267050 [marine sediment metagenome]|uniref:Uncharacterized protein n=1 Tax=marine sediment metagenome TaxID=412755 RepID=A0A0F9LK95_9ZZZZ